jgi:alkylated DNA repair dioxygenase AlkB
VSAQLALFLETTPSLEGLRYQPNFISPAEEQDLIGHIRALPLAPFQFGAFEGKRRVASFGWRYDYGRQKLGKAEDVPAWITHVIANVEVFAGLPAGAVQQVLCTEYDVGVGIGWHRDKPHFDQIFGLSLASACKFRFRRKLENTWERFTLEADPRSIYMMAGASRRVWEHSIPPVDTVRYSVTFRTMAAR